MDEVVVERNHPPRALLTERFCDVAAIGFALWTVCCHVLVVARGSLRQLIAVFATASAVVVAGLVYRARRARPAQARPRAPAAAADERRRPLWILQGAGLVLGLAGVLAFAARQDVLALWWSVVALLGAASVLFLLAEAPYTPAARSSRRSEAALWTLAAACVVVTLVCHRPDLDDVLYLNMAVAAADFPDRALLRADTLHGIEGLRLSAVYRFSSYEVGQGALSYLTGIPAIYCFHWISASIAAALVVLAHARLLRLLVPRVWPWAVGAVVVVLVAAGETHHSYGNFAFTRLWQGKAIHLSVFLPLVYAYAIQFASGPTPIRWLLLAAAQVAAVGCSATAVWGAPAAALAAMACVLRPTRDGLRMFFLGALASVYVLGVGWLLQGEMHGRDRLRELWGGPPAHRASPAVELASTRAPSPASPALSEAPPAYFTKHTARRTRPKTTNLAYVLKNVLGESHMRLAGIASILIAWACCPRSLAQRFAIGVPLAGWLVFLSPYWQNWMIDNVTGNSTYWRSLWSVPIPILMALVLIAPLHLGGGRAARAGARIACMVLLAAFVALVPRYTALSDRNSGGRGVGIRVGWPGLKVPEVPYRWATALDASVPPGSVVLAPHSVSAWVPTFHDHAYPLVTRRTYMFGLRDQIGIDYLRGRDLLTDYVSGESWGHARKVLPDGLEEFGVKAVCLRNSPHAGEVREILRDAGFDRTLASTDYEIWVRP